MCIRRVGTVPTGETGAGKAFLLQLCSAVLIGCLFAMAGLHVIRQSFFDKGHLGAVKAAASDVHTNDSELSYRDDPPALGVQFHGTWDMYYPSAKSTTPNDMFWKQLDSLAALEVSLLRVDVGWSTSQPIKAPPALDHWYNQRIALVLNEAAARGMQVLLTIHQSPDWTRSGGMTKSFPDDPAAIGPWAAWMAETFGPQVSGWEIWNEPNLRQFTGIVDDAEAAKRYAGLLREAATAIRGADSHARIVFGGTSQTDDFFISEAYKNGARPYFDIMAVHPYPGDQTVPPDAASDGTRGRVRNFSAVIDVMTANGDGHKPVWWTEFGYSVHSNAAVPASEPWRKGVADQAVSADYLRRSFELARTEYPQVRVAILYTAYKPPSDAIGHQYGFRLLEADGMPLLQILALSIYIRRFDQTRPV